MHRITSGPMPEKQHIDVNGEWHAYVAEFGKRIVNSFTNWARHEFSNSTPPDPAAVTGAPFPWQASDPVGPWSRVNLANGNLYTVIPIAAWPGVQFNLYHNSLGTHELNTLGGRGWLHSYSAHLSIGQSGAVTYIADDGREVSFTLSGGEDENDVYRMKLELVDSDPDYYVLTDAAQNEMKFNVNGRLDEVKDASGNTTTLGYNTIGKLASVTDQVDRAITLTYDASARISEIEIPPMLNRSTEDDGGEDDDIERIAELTYGVQSSDDFLQKVYSMRRGTCCKVENEHALFWVALSYEGTSRRMESITDYGDGGSNEVDDHHTWNLEYFNSGGGYKFKEVTNPPVYDFVADDNVATTRSYAYATPNSTQALTTVTDERDNDWVYTFDYPAGRLLSLEDPLDRTLAEIAWTDLNRPDSMTNVLGGITAFDYTFNQDGSETIEVTGPQNEEPVVIDLDALNNLTQITDPIGQATEFTYGDSANPTRMTAMTGEGAENTASFCWTSTADGDPLSGLPRATASPTNTTQGFHYDGYGNLRHWEQPVNLEEGWTCSSIPTRDGGGGDSVLSTCCQDGRSYISNPTGEPLASGHSGSGGTDECCGSETSVEDGCPTPAGDCPVTGCGKGRDAAGNGVTPFCTDNGCPETFNPPNQLPLPSGCGETCDGWLASAPIIYDANNRLVLVQEDGDAQGIEYALEYDARGRLLSYGVDADGDLVEQVNGIEHFHFAPNYATTMAYSDPNGGFRETYTRTNDPTEGDPTTRTIVTTYETDEAGRITSVDRDGVVTTYSYSDNGSPSVPNITVMHDDGAKSFYYLNDAGELCKIIHQRPQGPGDSPMTVVASFEVLSRDDNRRITLVEDNFLDAGASDDYRTEQVAFTYGSGDLDSGDLDSGSEAEPTKLYWSFLPSSQLATSDPNRLVHEVRTLIDENYSGGEAVTYDKAYRYDANGNRLALIEKDADTGHLQAVTRYNYMFMCTSPYESFCIEDGTGENDPPGTPDPESVLWMDYEGHGRDQLLSTQKFIFEGGATVTLDRVVAEAYDYATDHPHMAGRVRKSFRWDGDSGAWWVQLEEDTTYEYNPDASRLQKQEYKYWVYDRDEEQTTLVEKGIIGEYSGYDNLMGRRIATHRAQASCTAPCTLPEDLFADNKYATHHFDYYGLSQRVAVERISPWEGDESAPPVHADDKFVESYTYGPVGVTTRTVETEDADPGDNFDHWVLPDVFGGAAGLLLYDAQPGQRAAVFEHFDAFGVRAGTTNWGPDEDASRYRWRSQEGSETDGLAIATSENVELSTPTLVYMQTRHYDPALGRFIMADSIPMGAFSPQGLNRYAYCTNDPVNASDATGEFVGWYSPMGALILGLVFAIGFYLGYSLAQGSLNPLAWGKPTPVGPTEGWLRACYVVGSGGALLYQYGSRMDVALAALLGGHAATSLRLAGMPMVLAFLGGFAAGYWLGK